MAIKRTATGDAGLNELAINRERITEHLAELMGREGSIKYRQMSKGDAQVGMILNIHKNPIRSARWSIPLPDDATEEEKTAIELLRKWHWEDHSPNFDTLLGQILSFCEYGFSLFERVWKPYDFKGTRYLVPVLQQRMQTSIQEINPEEQIVKQMTIKGGQVDIPFKDLIFFVLNRQGEDLRGQSILRPSYGAWKRKNMYEESMAIGIQRSASGIPTIKVPAGTKVTDKNYIAARTLLESIVFHENAYMIIEENWNFEVHDIKFNAEQIQGAIDAQDSQMAISVLAQFILLGQNGNTGAFALSRDQSDFFLDSLQCIINLVELTFHQGNVQPFLKVNFGEAVDPERVQLKGVNLNKKAGQELANVIGQLKLAGFIRGTVDDEIALRERLELPELSEDEIERRAEEMTNPATDGGQNDPGGLEEDEDGDKEGDVTNRRRRTPIKLSEAQKRRQAFLDKTIKEVRDFMKANLLESKDKLMADIEATLKRGVIEIQGLKNIEVSSSRYQKALEKKLAGIAIEAWNEARKKAKAQAIKLAEDKDPKDIVNKALKQFILNQASVVSEDQLIGLKTRAILAASNGPLKQLSILQTMSNVDKAIDAFIDSNGVTVSGSLVVVGASNFGETQFYQEIKDQLWGYRFVAIDDERTSDICLFYNGRTFSVDAAETAIATPPLHPNCRSFLDPIYRSEAKPVIDDIVAPPSLQPQKTIY